MRARRRRVGPWATSSWPCPWLPPPSGPCGKTRNGSTRATSSASMESGWTRAMPAGSMTRATSTSWPGQVRDCPSVIEHFTGHANLTRTKMISSTSQPTALARVPSSKPSPLTPSSPKPVSSASPTPSRVTSPSPSSPPQPFHPPIHHPPQTTTRSSLPRSRTSSAHRSAPSPPLAV